MATTVDGQVSVRQIARTFASGKKAENLVYSSLADGGFPSGKVSKGGFYSEGTDAFVISSRSDFLKQTNLIIFLSLNFEIVRFQMAQIMSYNCRKWL